MTDAEGDDMHYDVVFLQRKTDYIKLKSEDLFPDFINITI